MDTLLVWNIIREGSPSSFRVKIVGRRNSVDATNLVTDVNGARANNVTQFARVECCNQFALTTEPWNEFLDVADHFSRFHITIEFKHKEHIVQL